MRAGSPAVVEVDGVVPVQIGATGDAVGVAVPELRTR